MHMKLTGPRRQSRCSEGDRNTTQKKHRYSVHPACAIVTALPKLSQLRYKKFLQGFDVIVSDNHYRKQKHEIHPSIQYLLNGEYF
jgi:hypothetical protein